MFDTIDSKKIPFYYIYNCFGVSANCERSEPKVILQVSDEGKLPQAKA